VEGRQRKSPKGGTDDNLSRKGMHVRAKMATIPVRFCTVCKREIALKRIMRASAYCSNECRHLAKNEMRQVKAEKACRHCGRPPLKPRRSKQMLGNRLESASTRGKPLGRRRFAELLREWQNTVAGIANRKVDVSDSSANTPDDSHSDKTSIN
jgi:hypothetical protein